MKVTWGSRDMIDSAFEMISVLSPSKGCESGHDHRQNFFGELVVLGVGFEEFVEPGIFLHILAVKWTFSVHDDRGICRRFLAVVDETLIDCVHFRQGDFFVFAEIPDWG